MADGKALADNPAWRNAQTLASICAAIMLSVISAVSTVVIPRIFNMYDDTKRNGLDIAQIRKEQERQNEILIMHARLINENSQSVLKRYENAFTDQDGRDMEARISAQIGRLQTQVDRIETRVNVQADKK